LKILLGFLLVTSLVLSAISSVIHAAQPSEHDDDLNGTWSTEDGSLVSIVHRGNHIEARVVAPSAHSASIYGWSTGDMMWQGDIRDAQIVGSGYPHYPLALKAKCANAKDLAQPLELQQVDAKRLLGRVQTRLVRDDCSESAAFWQPVEWMRMPFAVTETNDEIAITWVDSILFDFDSIVLKPSALSTLRDAKALVIDSRRYSRITIEGHTDDRGSATYNNELSVKRAQAVEAWLSDAGIGREIIITQGMGMRYPLAPNTSDANRARNRRVELRLGKQSKP